MKLTEKDAKLFFKLLNNLLCYVNNKYNIVTNRKLDSYQDFIDNPLPLGDIQKLQDKLFSDISIINEIIAKNPYSFNDEEISIIKGWENFIHDYFMIIKHLSKYTVIFHEINDNEAYVYGIQGLNDSIKNIVEEKQLVKMTLLPFKGQIVYSGIINGINMRFGAGYMRTIMERYRDLQIKYGIITSLPFNLVKNIKLDKEILKDYLKTEKIKIKYWGEILQLRNKNDKLETIYQQENNKLYGKFYKKEYDKFGVNGFFAIYKGLPVSTSKNKKDLDKRILEFVEKSKIEQVFIFQIK